MGVICTKKLCGLQRSLNSITVRLTYLEHCTHYFWLCSIWLWYSRYLLNTQYDPKFLVYDLLLDKFLYYCSDVCYCSCTSNYDSHSRGPWCVFFTRWMGMHCCACHYVIKNFCISKNGTCIQHVWNVLEIVTFFFSSWHGHFWGVKILTDIPVWVMGVQMNKHQNEHLQSVIMLCVSIAHTFCGSFWPLLIYFNQTTLVASGQKESFLNEHLRKCDINVKINLEIYRIVHYRHINRPLPSKLGTWVNMDILNRLLIILTF